MPQVWGGGAGEKKPSPIFWIWTAIPSSTARCQSYIQHLLKERFVCASTSDMMQYCNFRLHVKAKLGIAYYYTTNSIYAVYSYAKYAFSLSWITKWPTYANPGILCDILYPTMQCTWPSISRRTRTRSNICLLDSRIRLPKVKTFFFTQNWICKQTVVMSKW